MIVDLIIFLNLNKNLLGYYPSYIWVTNEIGTNGFKYKEKYLNNKYKKIKNQI